MKTYKPDPANASQSAWDRDVQINAHYLPVSGGYYVVCKSQGGDYYAGFNPEGDPACDGDIEYFSTLAKAKAWCERQVPA